MRIPLSRRVILTLIISIGMASPLASSFAQSPSDRPMLDRPPPPDRQQPPDRPPPPPGQFPPRDRAQLSQDSLPPPAPVETPALPSQSDAVSTAAQPPPDEAEIQLRDARQSNDAELIAGALLHLAEVRMNQSQARMALPPLEEALTIANETGNDRLGREASMAMAAAYDMLGDTAMGTTWRGHADEYRERMANRVAPPLPSANDADATVAPVNSPTPLQTTQRESGTVDANKPAQRWPWWLALLCALMAGAWWQSSQRAARLRGEAETLARQQRHLRSAHQNLKSQSEQFRQMAVQDSLTGTMNRQAFANGLETLLRHAVPYQKPVALFVFDLDHFKTINDRHGHLAGDAALKLVVGVVQEKLQSEDLFGRFGGDEFLIACFALDRERSLILGESIRAAVVGRAKSETITPMPELSISMGIAHATPASGYDLEGLFSRADTALYAAKRAGRNRVVLEDESLPPPPQDQPALRSLAATSHEA